MLIKPVRLRRSPSFALRGYGGHGGDHPEVDATRHYRAGSVPLGWMIT
jgi:hypothetical protein